MNRSRLDMNTPRDSTRDRDGGRGQSAVGHGGVGECHGGLHLRVSPESGSTVTRVSRKNRLTGVWSSHGRCDDRRRAPARSRAPLRSSARSGRCSRSVRSSSAAAGSRRWWQNTGAPRDTLATRLRTLVAHGILERRRYSDHPPRDEYVLTHGRPRPLPGDPQPHAVGRSPPAARQRAADGVGPRLRPSARAAVGLREVRSPHRPARRVAPLPPTPLSPAGRCAAKVRPMTVTPS